MFNEQTKRASLVPLIERVGEKRFLALADKNKPWDKEIDPIEALKTAARIAFAGNMDNMGNMTGNPFRKNF